MKYEAPDSTRQKFTQKERDIESGLDYFLARYYSSAQGRFTSVDPYNPIIDAEKEEQFRKYLAEPRNWNRYVYVWNNPFKYFDPSGDKVFVVTYTTGNSHGDDELRRSAETYADELQQNRDVFNPETDTVIVQGVKSHQDLQKVFDVANSDAVKNVYGKVEQVTLFAHSGGDGPTFHDSNGKPYQLIDHGKSLPAFTVNWSDIANSKFIGCNTSRFAGVWADKQTVTSYGYNKFAYFSARPDKMVPNIPAGGPVYLIAADYGDANGAVSQIKYLTGFGSVYPLIRHEPKPKK